MMANIRKGRQIMDVLKLTSPIEKSELAKLPRWAIVAFIARCGRRMLPAYADDGAEPEDQRIAVARAIRLAEERAAIHHL